MELHHSKHHAAYVNGLNAAFEKVGRGNAYISLGVRQGTSPVLVCGPHSDWLTHGPLVRGDCKELTLPAIIALEPAHSISTVEVRQALSLLLNTATPKRFGLWMCYNAL
eukprot:jgi/Botrbrau1/2945/Bobra.0026s0016.1